MSAFSVHRAVLVGLLTCGVALGASPDDSAVLKARMLDVIAAHDSGNESIPRPALNGALSRAQALEAVLLDASAAESTITLRTTGTPRFTAQRDASGDRLVIDVADTIVLPDLQTLAINSGKYVGEIEAYQHEIHPMFVTRVIVALNPNALIRAETRGADIVFHISESSDEASPAWFGMNPGEFAAARATEDAIRREAEFKTIRVRVRKTLQLAQQHLESSKMALLQDELAGLSASADTRQDLRRAYDRHQAQTAFLQSDFSAAESEWRMTLKTLATSRGTEQPAPAVRAYNESSERYAARLQAIQTKVQQQAELNELLARRLGSETLPASAGSSNARLAALDNAFASMRTTGTQNADTPSAVNEVDAIDPALIAPENDTLAILKQDAHAAEAAPPRPRNAASRVMIDPVTRPDQMAVLSSSSADVNRAERQGVIRLAQQTTGIEEVQNGDPATPIRESQPSSGPRRYRVPKTTGTRPAFNLYNPDMPADEDPLRQLVNIDFRDMDLTNVVSLLAQKGQINVIAGTEVSGTVTANLKNIPLGRAIEIVLRMNGLGIIEEAGVYRITSYEEAIAQQRETRMVFLQNAQADEVKETLEGILASDVNGQLISVSANPATNVVIISGPLNSVEELEGVVSELDVAEPVIPTLTMPIKLNYSEPVALLPVITPILSEEGKVTADARSRHIIVTDIPVKVQEIQALINTIDLPVKQVGIDAMIVDAQLDDDAETGIEWFLNSTERDNLVSSSTFENTTSDGFELTETGSSIPEASLLTSLLPSAAASTLAFQVLGGDIDLGAIIAAQVASNDAELLANPSTVTVENQPAIINITQEFPYQELTQTEAGGQLGTTEFKEIGTILQVTPRVTHDDHIIATLDIKQSSVIDFTSTEIPIEAKRETQTTLRLADGQTIFIGGLRRFDETLDVRKTPFLGDIPVLGFAFSNKRSVQNSTELLIFLTCNVLPEQAPDLTPYQREKYDMLGGKPHKVDGTRALTNAYIHPEESRDPFYKWRRTK